MCGRFVATSSPQSLAERFDALVDDDVVRAHAPDYNVTPRAAVPVVRMAHGGSTAERVVEQLRWGLVPAWADDPRVGDRLINARAETVATSGAFAGAFQRRRCLVVADGFYEWRRTGAPGPVLLHRPGGEPLAFAGLWEAWWDRTLPTGGEPLLTCTIVTTAANADVAGIHDRMPVVLDDDSWPVWLDDDADPRHVETLLAPARPGTLVHHPVSTLVNSPANNSPALVEPVDRLEVVPLTLFE
ncbi:MAG TPA: SOS response-associated peptidase [Acidimicrobiia bacterium]|nr:SOS response-associated peptidase [Acidimicrobiia bacterium]